MVVYSEVSLLSVESDEESPVPAAEVGIGALLFESDEMVDPLPSLSVPLWVESVDCVLFEEELLEVDCVEAESVIVGSLDVLDELV